MVAAAVAPELPEQADPQEKQEQEDSTAPKDMSMQREKEHQPAVLKAAPQAKAAKQAKKEEEEDGDDENCCLASCCVAVCCCGACGVAHEDCWDCAIDPLIGCDRWTYWCCMCSPLSF
jgi:hypothetical protein